MIVIAHISDSHFDGTERNHTRAQAVKSYLDSLPGQVSAVVHTGDVSDNSLPSEYAEARSVFGEKVITCPGNHDARDGGTAYREVFGPGNQVHQLDGAVLAMCDSTIAGQDGGRLTAETLSWLDGVLAGTSEPVLIGLHHPPVPVYEPNLDAILLEDPSGLAELISAYPKVVAVLCGHAHTGAVSTLAGRPVLIAPGVASTLLLPWESEHHLDYGLPPACAFHVLDGDRITTHYRVLA